MSVCSVILQGLSLFFPQYIDLDQGPTAYYTDEFGTKTEITVFPWTQHGIEMALNTKPKDVLGAGFAKASEVIVSKV